MHYLVSYEIPREVRDKAQERFKSGGAFTPQDGVTMVARWHHTSGTGGICDCRNLRRRGAREVGTGLERFVGFYY